MSSLFIPACLLQDLVHPNDLVVDVKSLDEQVTDGHGPHQSRARRKSYIAKHQLIMPPSCLSLVQDFETRVFTPYFFPTMDQVFELFQANPGPELVLVVKREHALQAGYVHVYWIR
jgi:hypothetical protein